MMLITHKAASNNAGTKRFAANGLNNCQMQKNTYAANEMNAALNYDAADDLPGAPNLPAMKAARRPGPFAGRSRNLRTSTWLQSLGGCHKHPHPRTVFDNNVCT